MIRALILLCCVTAAVGIWEKGYKTTFALSLFGIGTTSFMAMPTTSTEAYELGWVQMTKPAVYEGYEGLELVCSKGDYTLCLMYDDTGYLAGSQIALLIENFSGALFDWEESGFTKWSVAENGTTYEYYTIRQYYISTETLQKDANERIAARDDDYILQDSYIYLEDFNGILRNVSTTASEIANSSNYTEQGCMFGMGQHYYYKMTTATTCEVDTMSRWFPITYNDQFVAIGFQWPGSYTIADGYLKPFELPDRTAIKLIVPNGPECLYSYGDTGMVTMHTYFINHPYQITCLW